MGEFNRQHNFRTKAGVSSKTTKKNKIPKRVYRPGRNCVISRKSSGLVWEEEEDEVKIEEDEHREEERNWVLVIGIRPFFWPV